MSTLASNDQPTYYDLATPEGQQGYRDAVKKTATQWAENFEEPKQGDGEPYELGQGHDLWVDLVERWDNEYDGDAVSDQGLALQLGAEVCEQVITDLVSKRVEARDSKVAAIPANTLVEMTPALYQEFCQGGCVPACHHTDKWINIGQQFHLSTVQHLTGRGEFETRDVMLSGAVTAAQYDAAQRAQLEKHKDYYERKRKGGCFRVNGQIVL